MEVLDRQAMYKKDDIVQFLKGFYKGCLGVITDVIEHPITNEYKIKIKFCNEEQIITSFEKDYEFAFVGRYIQNGE